MLASSALSSLVFHHRPSPPLVPRRPRRRFDRARRRSGAERGCTGREVVAAPDQDRSLPSRARARGREPDRGRRDAVPRACRRLGALVHVLHFLARADPSARYDSRAFSLRFRPYPTSRKQPRSLFSSRSSARQPMRTPQTPWTPSRLLCPPQFPLSRSSSRPSLRRPTPPRRSALRCRSSSRRPRLSRFSSSATAGLRCGLSRRGRPRRAARATRSARARAARPSRKTCSSSSSRVKTQLRHSSR